MVIVNDAFDENMLSELVHCVADSIEIEAVAIPLLMRAKLIIEILYSTN